MLLNTLVIQTFPSTDINDDELVRVLPTRYAKNSELEQSFTVRQN